MTSKSFVLPAGFYFIGDPCFAVNNGNLWSEFLGETFFEENISTARGFTIWAGNTMYGDSEYFDNEGQSYQVISGLLGIVSKEDVLKMADKEIISELSGEHPPHFGRFVTFEEDFDIIFSFDSQGAHQFGHIVIETGKGGLEEEDFSDQYYEVAYDQSYDQNFEELKAE